MSIKDIQSHTNAQMNQQIDAPLKLSREAPQNKLSCEAPPNRHLDTSTKEAGQDFVDRDSLAENPHESSARLTAATLHLMSAYTQCACPKLAIVVEAHLAELARVTPDSSVRAVCISLKNAWAKKASPCAASGCFAENFSQSSAANPTLIQP